MINTEVDKAKYQIKIRFSKMPYLGTRIEKAFAVSKEKTKNDFYLRVFDAGLKSFWDTEENKIFDKKQIKDSMESMVDNLEQVKLCVDDIYVQNIVLKHLLVTLYNLKLKDLDNVAVDSKEVEAGNFSYMPDRLAFVLDKLKHDLRGKQ